LTPRKSIGAAICSRSPARTNDSRAKRAAATLDERVVFNEIDTADRETFLKWGISDALFIYGKEVRTGPPSSYDKLKGLIEKRVKRL